MKRLLCVSISALVISAQGGLVHRYSFDGNVNDGYGALDGLATTNSANLEAPSYSTDIPAGVGVGAPTNSLEVGMGFGSKKSGFELTPDVINGGAGSYSMWIKADTLASGRYIVASLPLVDGPILMGNSTSQIKLIAGDEKNPIPASFSIGSWHHVTATWDNPAGTYSLYLNGSLVGTESCTPNSIAPKWVRIGNYSLSDSTSNTNNQFEGHIYDVQFYDHALSSSEVATLHLKPGYALPPEPELVHRYRFDGNADDSVGGVDGMATENGTWIEAPAWPTAAPVGSVGPDTSLSVGTNAGSKKSGVTINSSVLSRDWGTFSFWFKPDASVNTRYILNAGLNNGLAMLQQNTTSAVKVVAVKTDTLSGELVNYTDADTDWHFYSATWDAPAGTATITVDNDSTTFNFSPTNWAPGNVLLGGWNLSDNNSNLGNQFDGLIYDAQIYSGPLSAAEVADLYSAPGHVHVAEQTLEPTLVVLSNETIVASSVVSADSTGVSDATADIQSALNAVAAQGGGTVFLPAGTYRVDGNLTLDYGVTLQGAEGSLADTVLMAYAGRGDTNAAPFIKAVSSEIGLIDLAIVYPEQTADNIQPYPATIETGGAATLRNLLLVNSYYGIHCVHINASVLENIRGTVLKRGIFAPFSSEFSWMSDIDFSNDYWDPVDRNALDAYTKQNLIGLEMQRIDGMALDGFSADDAMWPVYLQPNPDYLANNNYGLGGVVHNFPEVRVEEGWAPWYYGMHYGNLDLVPEAAGKQYTFAPVPQPARTDVFIDVTRSPYAALGNGTADDTASIQQALDEAGALGGGTVYLPQGTYKVSAPLTVPDGVELRGPVGTGKVRESRGICVLAATYGHDTANPLTDPALITLGNNAGVRGFSILHPLQPYDVAGIKPYPYDIRGNGSGCWVVDMMLVNAWFGIDLASSRNDNFLVRDLWATAYHKGIDVGGGSVGGKLERLAWSVGPLAESGWFKDQKTEAARDALFDYIEANSTYYSFGASSNLTTWGLVGFAPDLQCRFYEQNGESTQDAELWMSVFDVAGRSSIVAEQGTNINWYGFWATGRTPADNWLEVDPAFSGPLDVYGKTLHQPHQQTPLDFSAQQVRIFDEVSLTFGKTAEADSTSAGSLPHYAVDRNPRTVWEAPAGSILEVDLGSVMNIDHFAIESALFDDPANILTRAELQVSTDGTNYVSVATNTTSTAYWMTKPITGTPARYARLIAESASGPLKVSSFDLFNTSTTERPAAGAPPNLLLVFTDQQSFDMLGSAGNTQLRTPNLDLLASEGVRFEYCISSTPVCTPYRGMLLSGQNPLKNGAYNNDIQMLPGNGDYFGEVLQAQGYYTGYVGKWHLYGGDRNRPIPAGPYRYGFDDVFLTDNVHLDYDNGYYFDPDTGEKIYFPAGQWEVYGQTEQAVDFIEQAPTNQPWALFTSWHPPHDHSGGGYDAPAELEAFYDPDTIALRSTMTDTPEVRTNFAGYMSMVTGCDFAFGRLMEKLRNERIDDNTIIVFTSDHGDLHGAHGRPWAKSFPEDESVRVPLLIRYPEKLRPRDSELLVGTLDLMPTILGLMDIPVPETCDGQNLTAHLIAEDDDAVESVPLMYFNPSWRGVFTRDFTYSELADGSSSTLDFDCLYDRVADPLQTTDLFGDPAYTAVQQQLKDQMQQWLDRFEDPFLAKGLFEAVVDADEQGVLPGRPVDLLRDYIENRTSLTHRYRFEGDVTDSVTALPIDGIGETNTQYVSAVPGTSGPTMSLSVGGADDTAPSGFKLNGVVDGVSGSYSVWLKADTLAQGDYLLGTAGFKLMISGGTQLRSIFTTDETAFNKLAEVPVSTGVWMHAVLTWDNAASNMNYYVNGVLIGSTNAFKAVPDSSLNVGNLNISTAANQFDGLLHDLQLYSIALSADDVAYLHSNPGTRRTPYDTWAHSYGLTGDALDDDDNDGVDNLSEFALGRNPTVPGDSAELPMIGSDGSVMQYVYPRRTDAELNYWLETSTNLVSNVWTNGGYTELPIIGSTGDGFETVTNEVLTAEEQTFIRLRVQTKE